MPSPAFTRYPFLAGLAGGAALTVAILAALLAAGTLDPDDAPLELAPRVRVWEISPGKPPSSWPQQPPGRSFSTTAERVVVDNGAMRISYAGTRSTPFAFAAAPIPRREAAPPVPPGPTWSQGPATVVAYPNNQQITLTLQDGPSSVSIDSRTQATGLLYRATGPTPLTLPLGRRPPGAWRLIDLNSRTWRLVDRSVTSVPLTPSGTYLALLPGPQELIAIRTSMPSVIELPPTQTQGRAVSLKSEPGRQREARVYLGRLSAAFRTPVADGRLAAGRGGQYFVLLRGPGGSTTAGSLVSRTLPSAATTGGANPATPALLAVPQRPVDVLLNETGQAR